MSVTEAALLDALKTVDRPEHRQGLRLHQAAEEPAGRRRRRRVRRRARLPRQEPDRRAAAQPDRRGAQRARRRRTSARTSHEDHRACGAARRAAAAEGEEHRRGRVGQGRRRQEHDRGQPRAGAGRRGRQRRHPRRRHLRPEPADDDGHRGPPAERRRQDDGADGELRRAGHVDRLPGRARQPDDLARPDGHAGARAAAAPDQLERPRLPDRRHAAGHRRHPAHAEPARAARPAR